MVALIAVSVAVYSIDKPYSYWIPAELTVAPGMRVIIPFGRGNRKCEGMVLSLQDGQQSGLKNIEAVLDEKPILSEQALRLAAFVRERYFCTFYDAIKAMLPVGHWYDASFHVSLKDPQTDYSAVIKRQSDALQVATYLNEIGGSSDLSTLRKHFGGGFQLDKALQYLLNKKLLDSDSEFSRRSKDKTEQIASLARPAEETMQFAELKSRSAPQQCAVLKLLCSIGSGSTKEICYLTGASMQTVRRLEKLGYLSLALRDSFRCPFPDDVAPAEPYLLNQEQQLVYEGLLERTRLESPGVSLLYGVTGSGKTAVYIRLIQSLLQQGKGAMLLVPEISLTPQLIQLLMSHFGHEVAVLHSGLRVTERYDEWKRIRTGRARVVIGTRSAVFAPIENLGIIIIDEEHEHTYKSENAPRYHAKEVAIYRGNREHALVLLGSATPSVESMYHARCGDYQLFLLKGRFNGRSLPPAELVDMKFELRQGNSTSISKPLRNAIQNNLADNKQTILFLNRRGAGRCMICVDCGEVPTCPRCSVSLTYHSTNHRLMCHYCGYSEYMEETCAVCGGHLKMIGSGTQKLQQELEQLFPGTPVLRMDADSVSANNTHEDILNRFRDENIPILIGTQMVTKGLNFENVTLVGVVDADMSLYIDHFRASETTFSIITQVVGRSGRGATEGKAIIQTMTPEHTVLQLASKQDYDLFYEQEITLRQLHNCPPFTDLITLYLFGPFEDLTRSAADALKSLVQQSLRASAYEKISVQLLGPAPASIVKINNLFRYRILVRCSNQRPLRQLLSHCLRVFARDKRYKGVTAFADVNSYE